ncbi:MAG TPA: trehalase family glycosidase [Acidobacteriaceae bacterium]|jgi:hypothetical protein|nr:trehalase family glycosidase [Acidobacteriaceae bacterium]
MIGRLLGAGCVVVAMMLPGVRGWAQRADHETLLQPESFHHYFTEFERQEKDATGKQGDDSWPWMLKEIPWFESSDKSFEKTYYFRWYAWQKHVVHTRLGWVITEWLPKPAAKDGFFGALPDAAPFHLREARWLHDPAVAEDDARFWFSPESDPRKYSDAMADAVWQVSLANGDLSLSTKLLPAMEANDRAWELTQRDANGLFWSIDTRDAMEKSISGDGYRPTLNSYMFGDYEAIAQVARVAGDAATQKEYETKAAEMRGLIEQYLWNAKDQFYEVRSPAKDSGIRAQKKFIDPGTVMQLAGVRELIGYIPWMFDEPPVDHADAWKQLFDPQGFAGKYGPTTAERRSPRFRFPSGDQCTWNGPSWPFATTQTLTAMANLLEDGQRQEVVDREDYLWLFSEYVLSQHLRLATGEVIPWIDEDLDADTDEWIAKDILIRKHKQVGRGNYYNHSGFADPLFTGLIGLRPSAEDEVVIDPLLPEGSWSYFAVDQLPYHGHMLGILYDRTGKHYGRGRGLQLFVDGRRVAARSQLGRLEYRLRSAIKR